MSIQYWIIDAKTGDYLLEVFPSAGRATRRMNGVGSGSHTFQLRDDHLYPALRRDLYREWARGLVIEWDGVPVYGGVFQRCSYDFASGEMTVDHSDYRTWLSRRFQFGVGSYDTGTRLYTGRTLRGIINQIVYYCTQGNLSVAWDLPIGFDMLDEAGTQSRPFFNYMFQTGERAIAEIQDADIGPDIDFQPRKVGDQFRAWLRVSADGTRLTGPEFEFHLTGEHPTAFDVKYVTDGAEMVTGVFAIGKGSEDDMRRGEFAIPTFNGIPSLDVTRQFKDIDDLVTLIQHAHAEVEAFQEHTEQWSFSVRAEDVFPSLVPGSTVGVWCYGDEWLPDGKSSMRVIGYSIDVGREDQVGLEVQPL